VINVNSSSSNNLKANTMKKHLVFALYISMTLLIVISCKKTKEITCDLRTSASQPPVEMNVMYTASRTIVLTAVYPYTEPIPVNSRRASDLLLEKLHILI